MFPSIYLPPNMTKLSLNCNVRVLVCDIVCVVLCVVKVFCVLLCVFFCMTLCVSMVLLCVSFCVSSLNRFLKHRHETDCTQTRSGYVTIDVPKGVPFETPNDLSCSYTVLRTLRAKMKKTNKSVHVTFRLTEDEYAPFAKAIAQLDISKSEFFRMLTLNRIENYQPDLRQQPDYKRCLFLMNKTSNNLNQIAHRLNLDHNKGIISSSLYERALNTLINIRDLLQGALK